MNENVAQATSLPQWRGAPQSGGLRYRAIFKSIARRALDLIAANEVAAAGVDRAEDDRAFDSVDREVRHGALLMNLSANEILKQRRLKRKSSLLEIGRKQFLCVSIIPAPCA